MEHFQSPTTSPVSTASRPFVFAQNPGLIANSGMFGPSDTNSAAFPQRFYRVVAK